MNARPPFLAALALALFGLVACLDARAFGVLDFELGAKFDAGQLRPRFARGFCNDRGCGGDLAMLGAEFETNVSATDGRVTSIGVDFAPFQFAAFDKALRAKYGAPASIERGRLVTSGGASQLTVLETWRHGGQVIELLRAYNFSHGSLEIHYGERAALGGKL